MRKSIFFGLIICFLSTSLMSHQRSESYSKLEIISKDNSKYIDIEFSIQTSVLQRLGFSFNGNWEEILKKELRTFSFLDFEILHTFFDGSMPR